VKRYEDLTAGGGPNKETLPQGPANILGDGAPADLSIEETHPGSAV
jgi:hypothetical protein